MVLRTFRRRRSQDLSATGGIRFGVTGAFGMDFLRLAQLPALFALGYWASLLLDLEKGSVGVVTG